jgi:hypothetical protein
MAVHPCEFKATHMELIYKRTRHHCEFKGNLSCQIVEDRPGPQFEFKAALGLIVCLRPALVK